VRGRRNFHPNEVAEHGAAAMNYGGDLPSAVPANGHAIGIDLGGHKTEVIVIDSEGTQQYREPADAASYDAVRAGVCRLVRKAEAAVGIAGKQTPVGVGIPGTVSALTGRVKNASTTVLNGRALDRDLGRDLGRPVRCLNDANCLALSEAVDGAGADSRVVFAVILRTGCGAGQASDGRVWSGGNLVAGEWGHNPLPWVGPAEFPGPACWCGKSSCTETWLSGPGLARDYAQTTAGPGDPLTAKQVADMAQTGDPPARAAVERDPNRLARALAHVINILDPDVVVLGGGVSKIQGLPEMVVLRLPSYVFGGEVQTPVVRAAHGDSSGVRGAAWLWKAR
jgi:fructokinase